MVNKPWVWPEVRNAGTSGAGAVPLRSAQLMGQQKKKKKKKKKFTQSESDPNVDKTHTYIDRSDRFRIQHPIVRRHNT